MGRLFTYYTGDFFASQCLPSSDWVTSMMNCATELQQMLENLIINHEYNKTEFVIARFRAMLVETSVMKTMLQQ